MTVEYVRDKLLQSLETVNMYNENFSGNWKVKIKFSVDESEIITFIDFAHGATVVNSDDDSHEI